jgi:magnesium-transporting ATPase (P-type)
LVSKVQRIGREDIEHNLTFLGLIILENRLKPESASEIKLLNEANIRTIMVTGDNLQTSISVAIECGIMNPLHSSIFILETELVEDSTEKKTQIVMKPVVNSSITNDVHSKDEQSVSANAVKINLNKRVQLALSGQAFETIVAHHPKLLDKILRYGTVFARMSPEQKQQLVEALQQNLGYFVGNFLYNSLQNLIVFLTSNSIN